MLVILAVVVFVVTGPLRRAAAAPEGQAEAEAASAEPAAELAELEAAREAKYREIRDAELDHRTGKLSDADFEAINGTLRAEAVQILRAIDRASGGDGGDGDGDGGDGGGRGGRGGRGDRGDGSESD